MCVLGFDVGAATNPIRESHRRAEDADEPALRRAADRFPEAAPQASRWQGLAAAVAVVDATIAKPPGKSVEALTGGEAQGE